jgi:pimeloyl-ACP methyl ester carboxylesterase
MVADAGALSEESLYQALSAGGRLATLVTAVMGFSFKFDRTLSEIETNGSPRVLIVSGDCDHMATKRDVYTVAQMISGAEVVILSGVAHWPMVEVPRELAPLMSEWLDRAVKGETR